MTVSVTAAGTASNTIAKQPASWSASASSATCTAWRAVRPWALKPPSAEALWGVSPTWPITGIPAETIARAREMLSCLSDGPPEMPAISILTASQPASLTNRTADSTACASEAW